MTFTQAQLEAFFFDPVMAAKVLMNADLDVFQRVRLRYMWWFPEAIDSSGVGTGKTVVDFIYLNLRCILIPNHYAAVYFPNFSTGKDVFWVKFGEFEERSEIFRAQFPSGTRKQDEDKSNQRSPGCWIRTFKNGSKIYMPAPDFKGDSKNQASRDFNTVLIDDYLRAADQGDGIDRQLVDRARRFCYNKNHPLWCNHMTFLGHAETPAHKEYVRYQSFRQAIREGSSRTVVFTFCYLDWSEKYAKRYREDNLIAAQKRKLSRTRFRCQYLGLWTVDGDTFYPSGALSGCRRREVRPMTRRRHPREHFFLGQDTAQPGTNRKADFSAWFVNRAVELNGPDRANFTKYGRYFHLSGIYAHQLKNRSAKLLSGVTYTLDARFGFTGIMLDPGGGGLFVLPEFREPQQLIANQLTEVIPFTTKDDPLQNMRRAIVSLYRRSDLTPLVTSYPSGDWYLRGDEGLVMFTHEQFRDAWEGHQIHWPLAGFLRKAEVATWSREQQIAQHYLDLAAAQLGSIRQLKAPDGSVLKNGRQYSLFEVIQSKKDLAYAAMYAYIGFLKWLYEDTMIGGMAEGSAGSFGAYQDAAA